MRRIALIALLVSAIPSTSPAATNGRIVFVRGTEESTFEIFTMAADGTGLVQLTDDDVSDDHTSFSPDGSKIVFTSNRDGDEDIWVMNADGSDPVQIVDHKGTDAEPTWSPDGTKIAYETFRHDPQGILTEIRLVNVDGTEDHRLTRNKMMEFNIAWSPDGTRIAFSGSKFKDGFKTGIFTRDAATGGDLRRITANPIVGFVDGGPAWSPNGRWIAFHREVHAFYEKASYEIFKVRSNGRRVTRLTRQNFPDQQPSWSPDGSLILYTANFQVATIKPDGSERALLTSDENVAHYSPSWQSIP